MLRLIAKQALTTAATESVHLVPALSMSATNRIRIQLSAGHTFRMQKRFHSDSVFLANDNLKPGYKIMHSRLHDVMTHAAIAAAVSPLASGVWLLFTQQPLMQSPVALAALGVGGCIIADRMMQAVRVKRYAKLSLMVEPKGPAISGLDNQRIRQIMAGTKPAVKFGTGGVSVSGPVGDIAYPSEHVENAAARIQTMNRLVIPSCVLTPRADYLADHVHDRWIARINFPLSILNIMAILGKEDKDRRADDYVVLAASIASIGDFFTGASVGEARKKLTDALTNCRTPEDVLKVLIDNRTLDEGGMCFLKEWIKNQDALAVRVSRTGTPILYKNRSFSFGGPYPIHMFPKKVAATLSETKVETGSEVVHKISGPKN